MIVPSCQEKPNATALSISPDDSTIVFNDVWFGYVKDQPILRGLTLSIPAGKKVAIIGGSGSGCVSLSSLSICRKSTIVRLLYRLYDAERGSITVAGQDVRDVQLESLRRAIAIVPQVR